MTTGLKLLENALDSMIAEYAEIGKKNQTEREELFIRSDKFVNLAKERLTLESTKIQKQGIVLKAYDIGILSQAIAEQLLIEANNHKNALPGKTH